MSYCCSVVTQSNLASHLWLSFGLCLCRCRSLLGEGGGILKSVLEKNNNNMHIVCGGTRLAVLTSFNLRDLLLGCSEWDRIRTLGLVSTSGSHRPGVIDPCWVHWLFFIILRILNTFRLKVWACCSAYSLPLNLLLWVPVKYTNQGYYIYVPAVGLISIKEVE